MVSEWKRNWDGWVYLSPENFNFAENMSKDINNSLVSFQSFRDTESRRPHGEAHCDTFALREQLISVKLHTWIQAF